MFLEAFWHDPVASRFHVFVSHPVASCFSLASFKRRPRLWGKAGIRREWLTVRPVSAFHSNRVQIPRANIATRAPATLDRFTRIFLRLLNNLRRVLLPSRIYRRSGNKSRIGVFVCLPRWGFRAVWEMYGSGCASFSITNEYRVTAPSPGTVKSRKVLSTGFPRRASRGPPISAFLMHVQCIGKQVVGQQDSATRVAFRAI